MIAQGADTIVPLDSISAAPSTRLPAPAALAAGTAAASEALLSLGRWLQAQAYRFVCPTPETHARVIERSPDREAQSLEDVFGWNLPFAPGVMPDSVIHWLHEARMLSHIGSRLRSGVRFASIGNRLFVHSSHPTLDRDAVFFGPDTYRFARFVETVLSAPWPYPVRSMADIGCGAAAGAILALDVLDGRDLQRVILRDINPKALQFAATNAALNDCGVLDFSLGDSLTDVDADFDLIIANPPYMIGDGLEREYRDGGAHQGTDLALRFLGDAVDRLAPGGRIVLYTGTPVVRGVDTFLRHASALLDRTSLPYRYTELDPDVFGESLALPQYADVDRIAVAGLVVSRPGGDR